MRYDAYHFIESIRQKFWLGMLSAIDAALVAAARGRTGRQPLPLHPGSDAEFMRFLMGAREYLLGEGRLRPAGLDDETFHLLRALCEALVVQGRFPPARLDLFAGLGGWPAGTVAGPDTGALDRKPPT